jgi:hypothetical protein
MRDQKGVAYDVQVLRVAPGRLNVSAKPIELSIVPNCIRPVMAITAFPFAFALGCLGFDLARASFVSFAAKA